MNIEKILKNKQSIIPLITQNPGIYLLINNEEIVYVGKSINPESRIKVHSGNINFDSYSIIRCNEQELEYIEMSYIIQYHPIHNKIVIPSIKSRLIGSIVPEISNQRVSIPGTIISNKLYLDFSDLDFDLSRK